MDPAKNGLIKRFWKHLLIINITLIAVVLVTIFTNIFQTSQEGAIPQPVWLMAVVLILTAVVVMLSKTFKINKTLQDNGAMLEEMTEALKKDRSILTQIDQNTRLSETAQEIAFREAHRQALREVVFDKLQLQDFDNAYEIIEEIAHSTRYQKLAQRLRAEADRYRDATDAERVNQLITHIEKLLEDHQWTKASVQIEKLIKTAPAS